MFNEKNKNSALFIFPLLSNNLNLNTMKTRILFLGLLLFILNACIVKSLNPFYTQNTKVEDTFLEGKWTDKNEGVWELLTFESEIKNYYKKEEFDKDGVKTTVEVEIKEADKKLLEEYKNSYFVKYTHKNEEEAYFIATPFEINGQVFLDFTPFMEGFETGNDLAKYHMIGTHSLVKYEKLMDNQIKLTWFDEDVIKDLLDNDRVKIKHEKIGIEKKYLLTASSEELTKFLEKFLKNNDTEIWSDNVRYTLTKNES